MYTSFSFLLALSNPETGLVSSTPGRLLKSDMFVFVLRPRGRAMVSSGTHKSGCSLRFRSIPLIRTEAVGCSTEQLSAGFRLRSVDR